MAHEIKMPQLGLTMTEGTIGRWLKNEGDAVNIGDILVEIETDKLVSEIESEFSGVLLKIIQKEGDEVPVQGLLALIGDANEKTDDHLLTVDNHAAAPSLSVENQEPQKIVPSTQPSLGVSTGRIKVSPLAKKMALERNISLTLITGSGPGGRIVKKDILNYKAEPIVSVSPNNILASNSQVIIGSGVRREKMKSMRKTVASRMLKSHLEIPNVTQTVKVDVTDLLEFRKNLNAVREESSRFSVNDFILKATAKALSLHKEMLVSIDNEDIIYHNDVNLGMAVGIDSGLIVPVIKQADTLSLESISLKSKELSSKAREGTLSADEYQGNTFTISNLGMYGIESFTPIINQPDAAILGVCAVQEELALDENDNLVKRQVMRLSLTFDHRLLDGVVVAKFQKTLSHLLENHMNILL